MEKRLAECQRVIGYHFANPSLLEIALTHSSLRTPDRECNERLEFLGDAVINLAISEALFAHHPDGDEGLLSSRRAAIVSTTGLARLASRIKLGDALRLGEGEAQRGGRLRPSLLASTLEAVAGAILLDRGWDEARAWVVGVAEREIRAGLPPSALKSPKSRLQEHTQRISGGRPEYRLLEAEAQDDAAVAEVEFALGTNVPVAGRLKPGSRVWLHRVEVHNYLSLRFLAEAVADGGQVHFANVQGL